MRWLSRTLAVCLALLAAFALAEPDLVRLTRAGTLLAHLSAPASETSGVQTRETRVADARARWYWTGSGPPLGTVVLAHGVHHKGIDEPRLIRFAKELAGAGQLVLTPELADIASYRITQRGVDVLKASVQQASADPRSAGRTGLIGMSFAGGLSLIAASDPTVGKRLSYVTSVGGHHDLGRVLRFFLSDTVETPDGKKPFDAHEYGLVVMVNQHLESLVEQRDHACMHRALQSWLKEDLGRSATQASRCTSASARNMFELLQGGNLKQLAPTLRTLLAQHEAELAQLSPAGRLSQIRPPVYLLHGAHDNVIPPAETEWAERELVGSRHSALVTPLLGHVEVDGAAAWTDQIALVGFMARML